VTRTKWRNDMKRSEKIVVLVLAMCLSQLSTWAKVPEVYLHERSGPHLEQIVVVESREFHKSRLRTLALQFVKDVGAGHVTGTLWIVTSRLDGERLRGVRVTDQSYAAWRRSWIREYKITYPVGRVSVVSGSARLEVRMPDGLIEKEVIAIEDPFLVKNGGVALEVYYLYMMEIRGLRGEGPVIGYKYNVIFCSRDIISVPLTSALMKELSRRLNSTQIQASLRFSSWIRHANLPVVYPFDVPVIPPMAQKAADPYESWCELAGAAIKCDASK